MPKEHKSCSKRIYISLLREELHFLIISVRLFSISSLDINRYYFQNISNIGIMLCLLTISEEGFPKKIQLRANTPDLENWKISKIFFIYFLLIIYKSIQLFKENFEKNSDEPKRL